MLEIKDLQVSYGGIEALRGISLQSMLDGETGSSARKRIPARLAAA